MTGAPPMKSEATPGREGLLGANMQASAEVGPLQCSQGGYPYNGDHIEYWKIRALKAERRLAEDTRLASNVREATIRECAKLVKGTGLRNPDNIARDILALAGVKPADEGARDRIIKILKSQVNFSQLAEDVSACITNAPELTDKILAALSTTTEPKQPGQEGVET